MKYKHIVLLGLFIIIVLIGMVSTINYLYLLKVQTYLDKMIWGNQQEIVKTSKISFNLIELNILLTKLENASSEQNNIGKIKEEVQQLLKNTENEFQAWKTAIQVEIKFEAGEEEEESEEQELNEYNLLYSLLQRIKGEIDKLFTRSGNQQEKITLIKHTIKLLTIELSEKILNSSLLAHTEFNTESQNIKSSLTYYGWINLSFFMFFSFLMLMITYFLVYFSIKNLEKFTFALKKMTSGDLNARIELENNNEFGELAKSFNKMAQELADAKLSLEKILTTMPNMLLITDMNLNIIRVNDRACTELGYFKEELQGVSLTTFFEDPAFAVEIKALPSNSILTKKIMLQFKNKKIPVIFSSSVMILAHPYTKYFIHIAQDITAIKKIEEELIATSRQAGMADIATSVLHNVGNVLNSIKTAISVIEEAIQAIEIEDLEKIASLIEINKNNLNQFLTNDPKGKNILNFLNVLANVSTSEKKIINTEICQLKKYIEHITDIITTQQKMNTTQGILEIIDVGEIINEAIHLNQTSFQRNAIKIIRDFKPIKKVILDKNKFLQVAVNIIKNAYESLLEATTDNKILKVNILPKDEKFFIIQVMDNGVGILPENLVPIFSFGFTTKKNGHGFGLHSSALSIKEMGGELNAYSEGLGKGAVFTMILPYQDSLTRRQHGRR